MAYSIHSVQASVVVGSVLFKRGLFCELIDVSIINNENVYVHMYSAYSRVDNEL